MRTTQHLRARGTAAVVGIVALLAVALTGCTPPDPGPSPSPTATIADPKPGTGEPAPPADTAAFRAGQAANGGTFAPLRIPDGVPFGNDLTPRAVDLNGTGLRHVGDDPVIIWSGPWSRTNTSRSEFLFTIDAVTDPLTGPDYEAVYAWSGLAAGGTPHGANIQMITYRVREISATRDDGGERFDLYAVLTGLDVTGANTFLLPADGAPLGCQSTPSPFADHGWATGDTVQGCMFSVTAPPHPDAMFYGIRTEGRLPDGTTVKQRMFVSDKLPVQPDDGH